MKKLKLNIKNFTGAEVLSRTQLKKIMGGNFNGSANLCENECDTEGAPCSFGSYNGTCIAFPAGEGCSPNGIVRLCVPE